ncbi:WXG100 family type VII secretion target [Blastococcus sp. SYSU D00820]
MTTTGMDLAGVRQMAEQLRIGAEQLRTAVGTVDGRVTYSTWVGGDADTFRGAWWPANRQLVLQAADGLTALAQTVVLQADEQERASTNLFGTVPGGPGPVGPSGRPNGPSGPSGPSGPTGSGDGDDDGWSPWTVPDAVAGFITGITTTLAWKVPTGIWANLSGLTRIPGLVAAVPGWVSSATGAVADAATPVVRGLTNNPFVDLRATSVTTWLTNPSNLTDVFHRAEPILKPLDRILGVTGVVDEGAQTYEAIRQGDWGGAALHGADTIAAAAKMSKNPLLYAGGVGVDAATDVVAFFTKGEKINPLGWL